MGGLFVIWHFNCSGRVTRLYLKDHIEHRTRSIVLKHVAATRSISLAHHSVTVQVMRVIATHTPCKQMLILEMRRMLLQKILMFEEEHFEGEGEESVDTTRVYFEEVDTLSNDWL